MAFELSDVAYDKIIDSLFEKQLIHKREAGNGYFLIPKSNAMACDAQTGFCMI